MSFDLDAYTRAAAPIDVSDIAVDTFENRPLSGEALRCLHYMTDVETHTVCYLRDVLVTPSHQDPVITAFLTMWAYEEFWHGQVLDQVLIAHGEEAGPDRVRKVRLTQGFRNVTGPLSQCVAAAVVGQDFIAAHMAWGALNEWSTHAAYARLAAREDNPILTTILRRIMRQETRHIAFYRDQAERRLRTSSRARRLTRFALRRFWAPVGSTVMPKTETAFLLGHLFGGPDGSRAATAIDHKLDHLPGLTNLQVVQKAMSRYRITPAYRSVSSPSAVNGGRPTDESGPGHRNGHAGSGAANK